MIGDIDSILIEDTINVKNFSGGRKKGFSDIWEHGRTPLNLQWPVLKNGRANFHHYWLVDST